MNLRRRRVIFAFAVPIAFGLLSLVLGRDANWDLRNYHWYNPYAFLTGRHYLDLAPAGLQNFLTPLLDIPWFIAGQALPGPVVGFLLGAVQSLNLILLYFIAFRLLPFEEPARRNSLALWVAIAGMCGGGSLGLLGTTFQDNIVSIGVLGSVLALVRSGDLLSLAPPSTAARRAALAAVPVALAVAGKITAAPYGVALAAALLFWPAPAARRVWLMVWFAAGFAVVAAAVLGPRMWQVWQLTGNPLFPFLDFPGARFPHASFSFTRFLPGGWFEALIYPFVFSLDPLRVGENEFRDYRIAAAYAIVPFCVIAAWRWRNARAEEAPKYLAYVIAAFLLSYALWVAAFSIYRYGVTAEMLAPLVIAISVAALPIPANARVVAIKSILLVLMVTAWPPEWGRGRWTAKFVEVQAPPIARPASTLVLLLDKPLAYVVPAFPSETAFVLLVPEFTSLTDRGAPWNRMIQARIDGHRGEMFGLVRATRNIYKQTSNKWENAQRLLSTYGLRIDERSCRPVPSNFDGVETQTLCDAFDWLGLRLERERCAAPAGPEISPQLCRVIRR
jgi:hypothetical protein